ncbi:MAG TPA: NAD-dependent epimerase/dehydratase family protein [Allosphingosinicella sp.]|nr:NAD-dependent epimerase/dehydratase family protein [Allosphingosinicella sp.]
MKLVVLGLSLSSSWGNGHATTFRSLLQAFAARGHDILFLERDVPWYADHRDCPDPSWCRLELYDSLDDLGRWAEEIAAADAVMVGSYVPQGVEVGRFVQGTARGVTAFYDIDTPVTLAKLARGDFEYLSPELIPGYDVYLSFTGGPTLARLERESGSPAARALYCCVDPAAYAPLDVPKKWALSYLGTYSADRQPTLERLLIEPARRMPHARFVVAGPQYPADIEWPANVERIDHVPPADHPAFYAASRFTLNVTRADMIEAGWSPSVRLFEAAACGIPIISDRWDGLSELLEPEREILLADSAGDVVSCLSRMSDGEAAAIGRSARERVLEAHSARQRARELEQHLREAADARRAALAAPTPDRKPMMKNDRSRTVLVTGGAGFIGSHICDALMADGATVICLDSFLTGRRENIAHLLGDSRFELIEADVIDPLPAGLARRDISRIYHLACAASPPHYQADPEHTMLTNVLGTRNMLRLAETTGARLLLSSTSEVYGDPEVHPQAEDYRGWVSCTGPRACYDEGKRAAETLAFDYLRAGRCDVRVARIFNTYGPRMRPDDGRVVSNVICQALAGRDITVYGDGSQTRSFCYVSDLVDGLMRLMESEEAVGFPVNLGNPVELSVGDLVQRVVALTGSTAPVVNLPLPEDDPRRRKPDIGRAQRVLGWRPRVALQDGLEATTAWFAEAELGIAFDDAGGARPERLVAAAE